VAWRTAGGFGGIWFLIPILNSVQWWMNNHIPQSMLDIADSDQWRTAGRRVQPWDQPRAPNA
jgi:hypothetical protein